MLDKYLNKELNEDEEFFLMSEYFKEKERRDFKQKWNRILEEGDKKAEVKEISFFRKHTSKFAVAASIVVLLGVFGIVKYNLGIGINFTNTSKGKIIKLNKEIKSYSESFETGRKEKELFLKFNAQKYEEVVNLIDRSLKSRGIVSEDSLLIASFAAVKLEKYEKARKYANKIRPDSKYYEMAQKVITSLK